MTKKLIQIKTHVHVMSILWVINNICTNHCDYCQPILHRGTNHNYEWENAKSFIERIFSLYPRVNMCISGGEPTVSPFLPELVKMFNDRESPIGITTNGVRSIRYYEELSSMLSYIAFSFHPSYEDSEFLDKVIACSPYTSVSVRLMMDSRYWDRCIEIHERCLELKHLFSTEIIRVLPGISGNNIGAEYSVEQLEWLKNNTKIIRTNTDYKNNPKWRLFNLLSSYLYNDGSVYSDDHNSIISRGENDFRGWACNAGIESLCIHHNGWVGRATCKMDDRLFHIDDHMNHSLPESGVICTQSQCLCVADVKISKIPVMDKNDPWIIERSNKFLVLSDESQTPEQKIIPIKPV